MPLKFKEPENSEHWDEIKRFVGGAKKDPKHPLVQEAERIQSRQPEHLDEGGLAGDPSALDVPHGTIPMAPPSVAPAPNAAAPEASYDAKASTILGGITPEAIAKLMDTLNQQGKRAQLGAGIAGIGDAIASVGGQNPGHMKAAEDTIEQGKELGLKLPGEMAAVGKERYGLSTELQGRDPNSPYSKVNQKTYGPDLVKMGLKPDEVAQMPAALIADLMGKKVTLEEARARIAQEGAYQQGMLENTRAAQEQTKAHQQAEEAQAKTGAQQGAAKALSDRGIFKTMLDAIPGTAGNAAKKVLEHQATGQQAVGPYGNETVRDGKTYEWSPETGKYHLKS